MDPSASISPLPPSAGAAAAAAAAAGALGFLGLTASGAAAAPPPPPFLRASSQGVIQARASAWRAFRAASAELLCGVGGGGEKQRKNVRGRGRP